MTPAETALAAFDIPAHSLADLLGVHRATVYRWLLSGHIPQAYHAPLLAEAKRRKVPLTFEQLHYGRSGVVHRVSDVAPAGR